MTRTIRSQNDIVAAAVAEQLRLSLESDDTGRWSRALAQYGLALANRSKAMDYNVVHRYLAAMARADPHFVELIIRLPQVVAISQSPKSPMIEAMPAVPTAGFTVGSFSRSLKIGDRTVSRWFGMANAWPKLRMLVGSLFDLLQATQIAWRFAGHGIDKSRVTSARCLHIRDHLVLHHKVDIVLDSFPSAGGSTSMRALWMGVPVLIFAGDSVVSCQSAAFLRSVKLSEFFADSQPDVVGKAGNSSHKLMDLEDVLSTMRERVSRALYRPTEVVAEGLIMAVRAVGLRHIAGLRPVGFEVGQ